MTTTSGVVRGVRVIETESSAEKNGSADSAVYIAKTHGRPVVPLNPITSEPYPIEGWAEATLIEKYIREMFERWPNAIVGIAREGMTGGVPLTDHNRAKWLGPKQSDAETRRARFGAVPSLADILAAGLEPPAPLVGGGLIRRGDFVILAGDAYTGKTWLLLDLALALATGEPWIGYDTEPARVGLIPRELSAWDFCDRVEKLAARRGIEDLNSLSITAFVHPAVKGRVDLLEDADGIADWIKARELDVIIIDPLSRVMSGTDKNDEDLKPVLAAIDDLRETTGVTVILAHHFKKPTGHGQSLLSMIRGHTLLSTNPTVNIALELKSGGRRRLSFWCNHSEAPEPTWLDPEEGGGFRRTDAPSQGAELGAENREKILAALREHGPLTYKALEEKTGIPLRTVRNHVRWLSEAGIVTRGGNPVVVRLAGQTE